jgi:hypothetical protein
VARNNIIDCLYYEQDWETLSDVSYPQMFMLATVVYEATTHCTFAAQMNMKQQQRPICATEKILGFFLYKFLMDSEGALQPVTLGRNISRKQKPIGWIPKNEWAKIALLVSLIQCILASGIELFIAVSHNNYVSDLTTNGSLTTEQEAQGNAIVVYHVLFIASQFFQLILIADAVSLTIIIF